MVAVIIFGEPREHLVVTHALALGQQLHVAPHRGRQLCLADAADGGEPVGHGYVVEVVQLAEDAELRKLRDASDEHELQPRVEHLQRTVEVLHQEPQLAQVLLLVHHVEQRSVILVDDDHNLLPRLLVGFHHEILQADIGILLLALVAEQCLMVGEDVVEITPEPLLVHVLGAAHVEVEHGVPHPFLLIVGYGETLEQLLATGVVGMERGGEERLAEPPRAAQEDELQASLQEVDYIPCLVHVDIVALDDVLERLYADGVSPYLLFHVVFLILSLSYEKNMSQQAAKKNKWYKFALKHYFYDKT